MVAGGVLYAIGLFIMSRVMSSMGLHLSVGLIVGFALSATTYVVVLGAVGQLVPQERRSSTFGIITAVGSSGMFVFPPLAQLLINEFGWQTTLVIMGVIILVVIAFAFGMPHSNVENKNQKMPNANLEESYTKILKTSQHSSRLPVTHCGLLCLWLPCGLYWHPFACFFV